MAESLSTRLAISWRQIWALLFARRGPDRYHVRASRDPIQVVRPVLHHPSPFRQVMQMRITVVRGARFVTFHVRQLSLNRLGVKTVGIEDRRRQRSKAVAGHLFLVAHPLQRSENSIVAHRRVLAPQAREEELAFLVERAQLR